MTADELESTLKMGIGGVAFIYFGSFGLNLGLDPREQYWAEGRQGPPPDRIVSVLRMGDCIVVGTERKVAHINPADVTCVEVSIYDVKLLDSRPVPGNYL